MSEESYKKTRNEPEQPIQKTLGVPQSTPNSAIILEF